MRLVTLTTVAGHPQPASFTFSADGEDPVAAVDAARAAAIVAHPKLAVDLWRVQSNIVDHSTPISATADLTPPSVEVPPPAPGDSPEA